MTYKGYAARIDYDDQDGILIGHIAGIRDRIGFHAETVDELRAAVARHFKTPWMIISAHARRPAKSRKKPIEAK